MAVIPFADREIRFRVWNMLAEGTELTLSEIVARVGGDPNPVRRAIQHLIQEGRLMVVTHPPSDEWSEIHRYKLTDVPGPAAISFLAQWAAQFGVSAELTDQCAKDMIKIVDAYRQRSRREK